MSFLYQQSLQEPQGRKEGERGGREGKRNGRRSKELSIWLLFWRLPNAEMTQCHLVIVRGVSSDFLKVKTVH